MNWTFEADVELVAAIKTGEMHNWFVFCRKHGVKPLDTDAHYAAIKKDHVYIAAVRAAAAKSVEASAGLRKANRDRIERLVTAGPLGEEDKKWAAGSQW